jgi:hypothetical protein
MSKFAKTAAVQARGPVNVSKTSTVTFEGAPGVEFKAKGELFLLAVTNMVGEDRFYESANTRDNRYVDLIRKVAVSDPAWIAGFIPFLRNEMNMRSASMVMAVEAAKAMVEKGVPGGRQLIALGMSRADEPAEALGYWISNYGRKMPSAIKRGIADAANNLYNEYSAIKYDSSGSNVRMADVISLTHPAPVGSQSNLFRYLLDSRYGNVADSYEGLDMVNRYRELWRVPQADRVALLNDPEFFKGSGFTWESVSSWAGKMDAEVWEAIIPHMGYMALIRNLRNFEQAGVAAKVMKEVAARISDPEAVAKSRQFPYRMLSAYLAAGSGKFDSALEEALDYSCYNVPVFDGKTLVLVDTSGSMGNFVSAKSSVQCAQVAFLFGAAVIKKSGGRLVQFADESKAVKFNKGDSVLRLVTNISYGAVGHGTNFKGAIESYLDDSYKRLVIFSDMQTATAPPIGFKGITYAFDLGGYGRTPFTSKHDRVFHLGGFSDAVFKLIPLIERGNDSWPWETK